MPRYVMLIDAAKCLNCKACLLACQQQNTVPYGLFRNWVRSTPCMQSSTGWAFQPGACMHCDAPLCVEACPTHATYKAKDGIVQIDTARCIGCGSCLKACPYDARYLKPQQAVADKCDYCTEARAQGLEPACVSVCITRARQFGNAADPDDPVSRALLSRELTFVESPSTPTKPSLAYLGNTTPQDWPRAAVLPTPMVLMSIAATGVRWLGAISLFGVLGLFLKHCFFPPTPNNQPNPTHKEEA